MATQIFIQYNQGAQRVAWADARRLNEVTTACIVSLTMLDSTVIVLKSYETEQEAQDAREGLRKAIVDAVSADGGTTVIIDIEDY